MKKIRVFCFGLILSGCQGIQPPESFVYKEIITPQFTLASWQKITDKNADYRIYIEGDGHAFNIHGLPTQDPTPHDTLMRKISFNDSAPNVIYLARPCQFVADKACQTAYWTTKRFAPEVIEAEYDAIKQLSNDGKITLIGFSGGAQVAGLVAVKHADLRINKIITIAGNLDHKAWTEYHHLPELSGSLNLADDREKFATLPQIHFVGEEDKVVPPILTYQLVSADKIVEVENATHNKGWNKIFPLLYQ